MNRTRLTPFVALWLLGMACSWYPVQAARTMTSGQLELAAALATVPPLSVSLWFMDTSANNSNGLWSMYNSGAASTNHYNLFIASGSGNQISMQVHDGTVTTNTTVNTYSDNVWNHVCLSVTSTSSRTTWLNADDANKATSAVARAPTGLNTTRIGQSSFGSNLVGHLADVAVWSAALTLAECTALWNKTHPTKVRRNALISYVPVWGVHSPELDLAGARSWTVGGTAAKAATSPLVIPPGR